MNYYGNDSIVSSAKTELLDDAGISDAKYGVAIMSYAYVYKSDVFVMNGSN